ncbi:DDE superfamily endonuclease [Popillia japonica]|uniref:DDE superfamily endonuclease n=1 Tax=Popillia japonica TaxID=7064 RepID=A0AAW1MLX3_POPJA
MNDNFNIPPAKFLPDTHVLQPHVILGDEAFSLTTSMMKPYPQNQTIHDKTKAVYNYRHCRARRTSENAFGILCQYFRVFYTPTAIAPGAADNLIVTACILHYMLRNSKISYPNEHLRSSPELPKSNMTSLNTSSDRKPTLEAIRVRDTFKTYFNSTHGSVHWQESIVSRVT